MAGKPGPKSEYQKRRISEGRLEAEHRRIAAEGGDGSGVQEGDKWRCPKCVRWVVLGDEMRIRTLRLKSGFVRQFAGSCCYECEREKNRLYRERMKREHPEEYRERRRRDSQRNNRRYRARQRWIREGGPLRLRLEPWPVLYWLSDVADSGFDAQGRVWSETLWDQLQRSGHRALKGSVANGMETHPAWLSAEHVLRLCEAVVGVEEGVWWAESLYPAVAWHQVVQSRARQG